MTTNIETKQVYHIEYIYTINRCFNLIRTILGKYIIVSLNLELANILNRRWEEAGG